jgi:hypothetical protein
MNFRLMIADRGLAERNLTTSGGVDSGKQSRNNRVGELALRFAQACRDMFLIAKGFGTTPGHKGPKDF